MPTDSGLTPVITPPDLLTASEENPPFEPPPDLPEPAEPELRPRRRLRTALIGLGLLTVGAVAWVILSAVLLSNGIERIPLSELPSLDAPGAGPTNYLLVGTDSREDLPAELGNFFGDFGGERADVIMVIHVADGRLQMLSLPRDLRVEIPGRGADRINAAYAYGGPDLLVATVKAATGLPIHHFLEVRFAEFAGVVDALGGVAIDFPNSARDAKSGLAVEAGTDTLTGAQAVAYVRSRSYEELQDGTWGALEQGDIPRTARQQQVVDELLGSATRPTRLFTLPFVSAALGDSLRADARLSTSALLRLGWSVARAGDSQTATLPTRNAPAGGVSYLAAVKPDATDLLVAFGAGESLVLIP
jgi:LCP family protein required for cell wall assembly